MSLNYERWLGDVAIFRYNHFVDKLNGILALDGSHIDRNNKGDETWEWYNAKYWRKNKLNITPWNSCLGYSQEYYFSFNLLNLSIDDLESMNTSIANKSEKIRPSTGIRPSTAKKPPTILTKSRPQTAGFFKKVL